MHDPHLYHERSWAVFNINSMNFKPFLDSLLPGLGRSLFKKSTNLFDVCRLFNFVVYHLIKEFDWFSPDFIIVYEGYWHVWIQIIFIIRDFLWFQNIFFKKYSTDINLSGDVVHLTLCGKISEIFRFENLDRIRLAFPGWNIFYSSRVRLKPKNLTTKM